eukprot:213153_1
MSVKVKTASGAQYDFTTGCSGGQIRRRIQKQDIEANSIKLTANEIHLFNAITTSEIQSDETINEEMNVNVSYSRYPYLINLLFAVDKWYMIVFWSIFGSLWIAMWAQASFDLPKWWDKVADTESEVPISFQTFAIMVLSSLVGWKSGALAGILYIIEILIGLPFGAEQSGGWQTIAYSHGGYFVGFVIALFQIGYMAEKGWDRKLWTIVVTLIIGNLIIYACGLIWLPFGLSLKTKTHVHEVVCGFKHGCVGNVFMWGMVPFLPGDAIKIILATFVLKLMWRIIGWASTRKTYSDLLGVSGHVDFTGTVFDKTETAFDKTGNLNKA